MPSRKRVVVSCCLAILMLRAGAAGADEKLLRPASAASLFFIAKSENHNQVHYGIRLRADCTPLGSGPVYAYWRMLERGGGLEPLLSSEEGAYGVNAQSMVVTTDGFRVRMHVRGLPQRPIEVSVTRVGDRCVTRPEAVIGGVPAQLSSIYLKLRWPFGVDHLLVQGARLSDGVWLEETVRDGG